MLEFLAIDPGAHPGWAIMDAFCHLTSCGINAAPRRAFKAVLCERPVIYPKKRVDPANIITLAITAGTQVAPFLELGCPVHWVEARTWKGDIPKEVHHPDIWKALDPHEQAVVARDLKGVSPKFREDAMDAIGLALYARRTKLFR